jgi:hypothetical protein
MARTHKDKRTGTTASRRLKLDIPEREEDEEPATKKQLAYIRHLAPGIELTHASLEDLGKWQASALIDQIKEEKEQFEADVKQEIWEREEQKLKGDERGLTRRPIGWLILIGLALLWYFFFS